MGFFSGSSIFKTAAHHFVTKSWKSLVKTPSGSLGGGWGQTKNKKIKSGINYTTKHCVHKDRNVFCGKENMFVFSDLIDNVVQKFKDGHGRSTVHSMSCWRSRISWTEWELLFPPPEQLKSHLKQALIQGFYPENKKCCHGQVYKNLHVCIFKCCCVSHH